MNGRRTALILGAGCLVLVLCLIVAVPVGYLAITRVQQGASPTQGIPKIVEQVVEEAPTVVSEASGSRSQAEPQPATPLVEPQSGAQTESQTPPAQPLAQVEPGALTSLYKQINPGVVNIKVQITRGALSGAGAGSGFIIDNDGHIVTNSHVVANASSVTVVFANGIEAQAEVIGTDNDSDLAVVQVDELAGDAHPLPLGDSDQAQAGEWVVAVGNPFEYGGSMTIGIVSAVGRTIPSGLTPFSIPQAIQTDAAINPGNSGGPLLNLQGEVIGVNAQIRSNGVRANAGVGFAIPSNVVQRVVPVLIKEGAYQWPWLGVSSPNNIGPLTIMRANDFDTQQGAYITQVYPDSPADDAGLRGATSVETIDGVEVPVGGDLIVAVDGTPITNFNDLLVEVAMRNPGDKMELTVLRNGQRRQLTATLAARPANLTP